MIELYAFHYHFVDEIVDARREMNTFSGTQKHTHVTQKEVIGGTAKDGSHKMLMKERKLKEKEKK